SMPAVPPHPDDLQLRRFAPALVLICICVLINYVDRGNLSVAGQTLKAEFHLTQSKLGILFAAFFVTYTLMQFIVGWLVDHYDPARILAAGFLVWSLATAATGVAPVFSVLFAMRLILGIGEGVALPCSSKLLAQNLPERHRGFAAGAFMASLRAGNAVGTLGAGTLMATYGWRPVFIWIGLASLAWLPAWQQWRPPARQSESAAAVAAAAPGTPARATALPTIRQIYGQRSFWGTALGQF